MSVTFAPLGQRQKNVNVALFADMSHGTMRRGTIFFAVLGFLYVCLSTNRATRECFPGKFSGCRSHRARVVREP